MLIGIDANEANVKTRVGSNQYAFHILSSISKLDKKNSYLIYLKNQPLPDLPQSNQNWQYKVIPPKKLWTQWRLPISLYFAKPKPDIFLTLGHYAPRFSPIPTIITILDLAFLIFPKTYLKRDLYKLKKWTKQSVNQASHIITISNFSKKDIQKFYNIPSEKITVAYPSINSSSHKPYNKNRFIKADYLLYLGTLQPRKNLDNLIKAYANLPPQLQKNKLVIAGKKGWMYKPLFKLVTQLNLENKVIFTDFVSDQALPGLIKNAHLLILPSYYEGFGIPVIQAMKYKVPVLVSKNSSLKEIAQKNASYIKPPFGSPQIKEGIIRALSLSPSTIKTMTTQAYQRASQFSWDSSAKKIIKLFHHP